MHLSVSQSLFLFNKLYILRHFYWNRQKIKRTYFYHKSEEGDKSSNFNSNKNSATRNSTISLLIQINNILY